MKRVAVLLLILAGACSSGGQSGGGGAVAQTPSTAPSAGTAPARLAASPRHGEWVMIKTGADSVRAWIVYPERKTKAPVVVVVHEIMGVSNWIRSVTDQLAADGYIAIAPDLVTKFNIPNTAAGEPNADSVRARIREIAPDQYQPQMRAVAEYAMNLPAADEKYGLAGFCWGGGAVFEHAARYPDVKAVVSYYGTTPTDYANFKTPVLGMYGENDERVNSTIARADSAAAARGFVYEHRRFTGAGHGFLRGQDNSPANAAAAAEAWPMTVAWFRKHLGA